MSNTGEQARGKWRGILLAIGVDDRHLSGKHGPCPFCEGRDRFRWDNKGGKGTFFCSQCGSGDGFEFVKRHKGCGFVEAARAVDLVIGNVKPEPIKREADPEQGRRRLRELWANSTPIVPGDPAYAYLTSRVKLPANVPSCLRFAGSCPVPDGSKMPALIALVHSPEGEPKTIHRTFLGPNGKAEIATPRALMQGAVPDGSAVRLFPVHGNRLGIAEGIETAFAAADQFGVPVWSAINSTMLAKWEPPAGVEEVFVFGDADEKFGGQMAAYTLAHRLAVRRKLAVTVLIPEQLGKDWADLAGTG